MVGHAFDGPGTGDNSSYELSRCSHCGIVSTSNVCADELSAAYSADYYGAADRKFIGSIERILSNVNQFHAKKLLNFWNKGRMSQKRHPSVLDIGCGRGLLLEAFRQLGADALGFERSEFPASTSNSKYIHRASLYDQEYESSKFDIIIAWHVLEHLDHVDRFLIEVEKHVNENGILAIAVPNFDSFQRKLFQKNWFHLDLPRHLFHLEEIWIKSRLAKLGFTIDEIGHNDLIQNPFGFVQSTLNTIFSTHPNYLYQMLKSEKRTLSKLTPLFLINLLLAGLITPFAVVEGVISSITKKGATIQIIARKRTTPNDKK